MSGLIVILIFVIMLLLNVPIAISLGVASAMYIFLFSTLPDNTVVLQWCRLIHTAGGTVLHPDG